MKITAIHPARNEHDEIIQTCESMKDAGADTIIVFDDGSDTPIPVFDNSIHVKNPTSIGPSVCRNNGARMSRDDVFVFADAHTRVDDLKEMCQFSIDNNCIVIPSMVSLYGRGDVFGYSRDFILKGNSSELLGFNMNNKKPETRYSYCYGNWGGFFIVPRKVYESIDGWVDHKFWGYNDPSLILKAYFCNIDTVLDKGHIYKHKGKVKTGFGYPVKAIEPLMNLFHSYYVIFDKDTFENHWVPLLEKEHKWMFKRGMEYLDQTHIKEEEKRFKLLKKKSDDEFFNVFLKQELGRKEYKPNV